MSQPPRLTRAIPILPVLDLEATLAFYESKLGCKRMIDLDSYAGVERDGLEIHFWLCTDAELPRSSSCRFDVRGIDALYEECRLAGILHPNTALEDKPWGYRQFDAVDRDGNLLTFAQQVAAAT
jgi:catechol 2,3-dioxygenase-like lactoylglutathione lyase family enzyme